MLRPADHDLIAIADSADAFVMEHEKGASIFVKELLGEVRTAADAARRVDQAVKSADPLGAHVFLRAVVECAIRLRWVAGDGPEPGLKVLRERIERQRGRDLSRLRSALELLPESANRMKAVALVTLEQATIRAKPGPPVIEQLAVTREGKDLYSVHRLCSAVIHPGIGIRRIDVMDAADPRGLTAASLDLALACAATSAGILDRGTPDTASDHQV